MRRFSIRLHEDTILHLEKAAKKAGVSKTAMIRRTLEQTFDGTPHNPLGVTALPLFYDSLCEAIGVMCISGDLMSKSDRKLASMKAKEVRDNLEIDHEH